MAEAELRNFHTDPLPAIYEDDNNNSNCHSTFARKREREKNWMLHFYVRKDTTRLYSHRV